MKETEKYDEMRLFFRMRRKSWTEKEIAVMEEAENEFKRIYGDSYD